MTSLLFLESAIMTKIDQLQPQIPVTNLVRLETLKDCDNYQLVKKYLESDEKYLLPEIYTRFNASKGQSVDSSGNIVAHGQYILVQQIQ